ncbi:hypothetical protein D8674_017783 [Pyrus ussuriensis x Pyrus communis]|uniref:Myb-like domain-containing protein n=1 Tax=Pyrus ussuriensis x Pyrus communis TaxID=2448454 RepID=A0A5N5HHP0_9ROSA|nr:hypothetical protein D8674_017783 [Pyrus ussuriensis x Pyrus communis]
MASSAMKGRVWTRKEDEALCKAYRWVSEDSVREAEELYMESSLKPFQFHSCWEICKGWVLFEDPPKRAPTPVFEIASSAVDMDEDGSPTIQRKRVENPSSGEGSIPKAMERNKARNLKVEGKGQGK